MRVVVQRVLESLGRAPRVAATVRHGHTPASLLISRLQASARQNDLTPTTTLWQRRSSVCARPYPSERKDHGGTSAASSTAALEYVDWFSHRRPRPPKPNASPCLPPPSPPGIPPTSVQLLTTVYQHINLHRRYDVTNTTTPPPGQLRPLTAAQTDAFCTDAGSTLLRPRPLLRRLRSGCTVRRHWSGAQPSFHLAQSAGPIGSETRTGDNRPIETSARCPGPTLQVRYWSHRGAPRHPTTLRRHHSRLRPRYLPSPLRSPTERRPAHRRPGPPTYSGSSPAIPD